MAVKTSGKYKGRDLGLLRLSIRPTTHRGIAGYGISGRNRHGVPISIFTRTRAGAKFIKQAYVEQLDPSETVNAILRGGL